MILDFINEDEMFKLRVMIDEIAVNQADLENLNSNGQEIIV